MNSSSTRRRFLGVLGAPGVAALAGCFGDGADDRDADDNESAADDETVEDADPSADGSGVSGDDDRAGDEPSYPDPVDWTGEERGSISVGPGGERVFDPDAVLVRPGTTVRWVWESDGHDLTPNVLPEGADWDGVTDTRPEGFEHEFRFEAEGVYEYRCDVHAGSGMVGYVVVERA